MQETCLKDYSLAKIRRILSLIHREIENRETAASEAKNRDLEWDMCWVAGGIQQSIERIQEMAKRGVQ